MPAELSSERGRDDRFREPPIDGTRPKAELLLAEKRTDLVAQERT
jgi:hypothetical protein